MIQGFARHALRQSRRALVTVASIGLLAGIFGGLVEVRAADVFAVENVPVDARAESATAARERAIASGQQMALDRLFARLVPQEGRASLPRLSPLEVSDLVRDFAVEDERTSAVRYLANLSVRFRPDDIRALLRARNIPFAETMSKPIVVLPVQLSGGGALLWEETNAWRQAWADLRADGLVPFVVPVGDLQDVTVVDAQRAQAGDRQALAAIAERYGAGSVLVAVADSRRQSGSSLQVSTNLVPVGGGDAETQVRSVSADSFPQAAAAIAEGIDDAWRRANLIRFDNERSLVATAYVSQLGDLLDLRKRLSAVSLLSSHDVLYLARDAAQLRLHYFGDERQLATALAQSDLALEQTGEDWVLRRSGRRQAPPDSAISPQPAPAP
jgi:hypothetical protein